METSQLRDLNKSLKAGADDATAAISAIIVLVEELVRSKALPAAAADTVLQTLHHSASQKRKWAIEAVAKKFLPDFKPVRYGAITGLPIEEEEENSPQG